MTLTLNGSSVMCGLECSNVIEICDGVMFAFYTGLPHIQPECISLVAEFGVGWGVILRAYSYIYKVQGYKS